jgi:DNA repair photolyase
MPEKMNPTPKGRGTSLNTDNRFEKMSYRTSEEGFIYAHESFDEQGNEEALGPSPRTQFFKDNTRSILTKNDSPDVGFTYGINPYRGCEHGCAYCYARPTHEYLGMSAGLDFESKIIVKETAPELLRAELMKPKWKPEAITVSGNTDCYQPIERKLQITRRCLEVMAEFRNPVAIITKNRLVTRDKDILSDLARDHAVKVFISVTTLDPKLCGKLEPRTSRPQARLDAVRELTEAGIPVGVMMAPLIPGLTDHEIPNIIKAAKEAGAVSAYYTMLRLPLAVEPIFVNWVKENVPDRAEKIIHKVQSVRGGKMYDSSFASRMSGEGVLAEQIKQFFELNCRRHGMNEKRTELSTQAFRRPGEQMSLL